jgi:hypothetical protein
MLPAIKALWNPLENVAKRELKTATGIPVSIYVIMLIRQFLNDYFRFSVSYKWVYSLGSTTGFFLQMLILFFSLVFSLHLLLVYRERKSKPAWAISLVIAAMPVTHIIIAIA